MDYIGFSISNPVKVAVGVLLLLLFGLIALFTIPVQLVPNVDQPVITVTTAWVGRSPEEVEREIIEPQEDKLKGLTNLRKMTAVASQNQGQITLEFFVGTNMDRASLEASDSLREVPSYPADVKEPVITVADSASENAIAWMSLTCDDPNIEVDQFFDQVDKRVKPYLERVDGLSQINIYGGRERQVHIAIDPVKLAQRQITFNQLRSALQLENVNVSAGDLPDGRLDVRVRTVGQYDDLENVRQTIVAYGDGGPIRIKDLAGVTLSYEKRRAFVHSKGEPAMALNAIRETGSNVMAVMDSLQVRIAEVNEKILPAIHPGLKLTQLYDETEYIHDALDLVLDNLWQGGTLTVVVLLLFLLSVRPTLIVALAIPTSVVGTFLVMTLFGRNLNVVSLAGLAFAVGMVVDNAIVVLENIDRHLGMGKSPVLAAYDGTREVGLAVLASTATTLVVFIPVLTIQEEAGQLFKDISLAICAAVGLSMIVALTVIPSGSARWLKGRQAGALSSAVSGPWHALSFLVRSLEKFSTILSRFIYWASGRALLSLGIVLAFTVISLLGAYLLMPPTTYLPSGNRNLVFGIMLTPPAYNLEHNQFIAQRIEANLAPYWQAKTMEETAKLPPVFDYASGRTMQAPPIENFFLVSFGGSIFMGGMSGEKEYVKPMGPLLSGAMSSIPGSFGFAQQISLFGRGLGGTNAVDVEVAGPELDQLRESAGNLYMALAGKYGFGGVRPDPLNFNLAGPELQVKIDRVQAADLGVDVASLGLGVQALVDGAIVGDYRLGGDSIDILLKRGGALELTPERLGQLPVAVHPAGGPPGVVPLASIASIEPALAPQQIKRVEQLRAVTLTVVPPPNVPLQQATEDIEKLIAPLRNSGQIEKDIEISFTGTADKLTQVREALMGQWHGWSWRSLQSVIQSRFFLAMVINYLLMAALFESFLYPFVIMFSVPLAAIGGFVGLATVHWIDPTQMLDVVTMLGFVILLGTVVNNAILLVAQSLNFMRGFGESEQDKIQAMPPRQAIAESVRTRLRPILMTTLTTIFGLLPLVIKPGSGSELYRGLGSVVLGGLLLSSVFTLLVVPLLLNLVVGLKIKAVGGLDKTTSQANRAELSHAHHHQR